MKTYKMLTAEEANKTTFLKVEYSMQEIERIKGWVKRDLADRGRIVLRNVTTGEDEILTFNCNLCDKVGNCTIHRGSYVINDCHLLEYKEGWEEIS